MRLTIVGKGPSWIECPFETQELWGTATCLLVDGLKDHDFTRVFAFDCDAGIPPAIEAAKARNIPLMAPFEFATEPFPSVDIVRRFRSSFFLNTMSRMIAYAIYLKYNRLHIYGIDQGPGWGLQQSKPHVAYWIGRAEQAGIDVRLGRGSLIWTYRVGDPPDAEPVLQPEEMNIVNHIGLK